MHQCLFMGFFIECGAWLSASGRSHGLQPTQRTTTSSLAPKYTGRGCGWSMGDAAWKSFATCLASGPVNNLMMQIQKTDAKGGSLSLLLFPRTNMFQQCIRSLTSMILDAESPLATMLPYQFERLGKEVVACIVRYAFQFCLSLAGRIWKDLLCFYSDWRYKLIGLAHPDVSAEQRRKMASDFCALKPCCLDKHFVSKVSGA